MVSWCMMQWQLMKNFIILFSSFIHVKKGVTNSDLDSVFDGLNFPQLTRKQINLLDSPITLNELYEALKLMNHGKSPGLDGIPPELYLTFWEGFGLFSYWTCSSKSSEREAFIEM